jgi:hypothetical protein
MLEILQRVECLKIATPSIAGSDDSAMISSSFSTESSVFHEIMVDQDCLAGAGCSTFPYAGQSTFLALQEDKLRLNVSSTKATVTILRIFSIILGKCRNNH